MITTMSLLGGMLMGYPNSINMARQQLRHLLEKFLEKFSWLIYQLFSRNDKKNSKAVIGSLKFSLPEDNHPFYRKI